MKSHAATVRILQSFEIGKNTAVNSGIEIEVFSKGENGKKGPKLGTIRIGQGTFEWWAKNAKAETKKGKRPATISYSWSDFAAIMAKMAEEK